MLLYQAALPLSTRTLNFTAGLIRAHRRAIRSRWRAIEPGQQALLTLAYLHQGHTYEQLAPGFGISRATAARRVNEVIELLAAQAPKLRAGLRRAKRSGRGFVIIDGTLIRTDRLAADRPYYQVKHRSHGMNLQAIADPDGNLLWISGAIRGSIHDTAAARRPNLPRSPGCCASTACSPSATRDTRAWTMTSWSRPTRGRANRNIRRTTTGSTPGYADRASASSPNSKNGASCGNSAATRTGPPRSHEPSPPSTIKNANHDEKPSLRAGEMGEARA